MLIVASAVSFFLAFEIYLLIESWMDHFSYGVVNGAIAVLSSICIILAVTFYVYWTGRRIEFYDDFVRLFPRMKKVGVDMKYSEFKITWKLDRRGYTRCIMTIIDEIGESINGHQLQRSWIVYNINGKKTNVPLYTWLKMKTGTLSQVLT